jgi:hypothetical protein
VQEGPPLQLEISSPYLIVRVVTDEDIARQVGRHTFFNLVRHLSHALATAVSAAVHPIDPDHDRAVSSHEHIHFRFSPMAST